MNMPMAAEVFPAGEYLADELDARGWTQADFAEVLGRPAQFVSEIISGKKEITRESAAQIAAALERALSFGLNFRTPTSSGSKHRTRAPGRVLMP